VIGLYVAEIDATTIASTPSLNFLAAAAARAGSPRSSSTTSSTGWPLSPPASLMRLK
jgi:hypothetical protein